MSRFSRMHDDYLDPDTYLWEKACEICKLDPADCECPECPSCGEVGNPVCHAEAGIFGGCKNDFAYRLMTIKKYGRGCDLSR